MKKETKILLIILGLILTEVLSYLALGSPSLNIAVFSLIVLGCFGISLFRLEYGLLIICAELVISSFGRLFALQIGSFSLSLRMALFLAVMAAFVLQLLYQWIRRGAEARYLKDLYRYRYGRYYWLLVFFVILGVFNAFLRQHSVGLIWSDFNAWLFGLLLFPGLVIYAGRDEGSIERLRLVFIASSVWLSLKTILLLYVFTHNLPFAPDIYTWLRDTRVGEMTATSTGWPRIFIQSQIYCGLGLFLAFWENLKRSKPRYLLIAGLYAAVLLISFSRSFWAGLLLAGCGSLIAVFFLYEWKKALKGGAWLTLSFCLGFVFLYFTAIFPVPSPGSFNADFLSRISDGGEAAVASRWSQISPLMQAIERDPFFGQGFGATVTYRSSDPRILKAHPDGLYTTYAFEWGYLDLWLKLGFLGLLAYLFLIARLVMRAYRFGRRSRDPLLLGLASGLIFLAATNIFTPYLNHPLGIGLLLVGACLIRKDRVY